jgi:hypothetical protein
MFTSLGYFPDASEDRTVLAEAWRVVAAGGGMALDYLNSVTTLAGLTPETRRTIGSFDVVERRRVRVGKDGRERILKNVDIYRGQDVVETLREEVLLLRPEDLTRFLEDSGFRILQCYGDYRGSPFVAETSPRCFFIARRTP